MTIEQLVMVGGAGLAIYSAIRWVRETPNVPPDPWGDEVAQIVQDPQTPPVCHHCLLPQQHDGWFCPNCGSSVGPYNNYMPFVHIFSQGEVLRAGVNERFRRSWLIIPGYVLVSFSLFVLLSPLVFFAPVYWYYLYRNFKRQSAGRGLAIGGEGAL